MTLGQKQRTFVRLIGMLIEYAYATGYELTFGDAFRDPRVHGEIGVKKGYGHATSLHKSKLAIDLNLFKDGKYLSSSEDHRPLGEYWESLDPNCQWGGHFDDGNHYSYKHGGMK